MAETLRVGWAAALGRPVTTDRLGDLGRHDVLIPVEQLKQQDKKFVLPGATKEAIKALPKFEYARK